MTTEETSFHPTHEAAIRAACRRSEGDGLTYYVTRHPNGWAVIHEQHYLVDHEYGTTWVVTHSARGSS